MNPRKILFWTHLSAGTLTGIVIFVMSITGVILSYQRQINAFANRGYRSSHIAREQRVSTAKLLASAQSSMPSVITWRSDPTAPVELGFGRERTLFLDAYSGKLLGERKLQGFFLVVENCHRWLGMPGNARSAGRAITGACNLAFLVLVLTGPLLWWPRIWTWASLRNVIAFRAKLSGRPRYWNWHNVIGIWCWAPLVIIVLTGIVMSYTWANNLPYRLTGSEPPTPVLVPISGQRPTGTRFGNKGRRSSASSFKWEELDTLLAQAEHQVPDWQSISFRPPDPSRVSITLSIDRGSGGQPDKRSQLTLDPKSGMVRWQSSSSESLGRRLRLWLRFLHTGEAVGLPGQTIACMASAGASMLVFTGLSLGYRRLKAWICSMRSLKRTSQAVQESTSAAAATTPEVFR